MRKILTLAILMLLLAPLTMNAEGSMHYLRLKDSYWSGPLVLGANNTFTVEVESTYKGEISGISANLTVFDMAGSNYSGNFSYSGSLFEGQTLLMNFQIFVPSDAYASYYKAQLTINYTADGSPVTQTMDLYVTIHGTPDVRCSLSSTVKPGYPATAYLELYNEGDGVARDVRARITPSSPNVQVSSPVDAGILNPGDKRNFSITLYIGDTADEAVTVTVTVTWISQTGVGGQFTCTQALGVSEMPPKGLKINTNDTYLEPGKVNEIHLLIENEGNEDAYRASLTIQSPPNAAIEGDNKFNLGDFSPGESKCIIVKMYVSPSISGPMEVSSTLEWYDSGSEHHSKSSVLGFYVKIKPGPFLVAYSDKRVLTPGAQEIVGITLRNEGNESARSIRVNFVPSKDLAVLSASGVQLDNLAPGQGADISLLLYTPNVSYGGLTLTLQVSYLDEHDRAKEQMIPLSFITQSPSAPLISIAPLDTELTVDAINELRVKLKNEGGPADDLVVKISLPSLELGSIVGEDYAYVDHLDKGESVIRNFSVYLSPKAYGAVQFLVHVSYKDEAGISHQNILSFGVRAIGKPQIEVAHVSTIPSPIYPGDLNVKLVVVITNVGNYVAKNLKVNLTPIRGVLKPSSSGSNTFVIPALPPDQTVDVTFLVDIDSSAKPGRYEATLVSDLGNSTIPIQIYEKARFKLLKLYIPGKPKPGDRGVKLTLVMKNEAKATAKDVVIEIITPYLVGTTSLAIGDIPGMSNASAIVEVDIDKNAPTNVPVDIKISWKQEERSLYQTIHANITLFKGSKAWWEGYVWMTLLTIIIVAVIAALPVIKRVILKGI